MNESQFEAEVKRTWHGMCCTAWGMLAVLLGFISCDAALWAWDKGEDNYDKAYANYKDTM